MECPGGCGLVLPFDYASQMCGPCRRTGRRTTKQEVLDEIEYREYLKAQGVDDDSCHTAQSTQDEVSTTQDTGGSDDVLGVTALSDTETSEESTMDYVDYLEKKSAERKAKHAKRICDLCFGDDDDDDECGSSNVSKKRARKE